MIQRSTQVSRVLLVRPGATDFDDQGRMKGSLDMPLSRRGQEQVTSLTEQVSAIKIKTIYAAPCAVGDRNGQANGRTSASIAGS